jgi:dTDP-4-dehydrorhamnose 3,5-epimerase
MMKITETSIPGLLVIEPRIYRDARGYFYESFNERLFREHGLDFGFVQDNESRSGRNVIRGLHYQLEPYAQTKLLRVIEGEIFDVVVDLRKDSPAFGTWSGIEVSAENKLQVLVPKGCAHGFRVISESATVFYKCDEFYHPGHERGLLYSDHTLAIDWGIEPDKAVVSEKDKNASPFSDAEFNFLYGKI